MFFVLNSYGQDLNSEYLELKKSLLESQTDLIVELSTYCSGMEIFNIEDSTDCVSERPFYLFWTKNGKYFKRKFSNCSIFKTIEMEKSDFLKTVNENLNGIKNAELLPVMHRSEKNSKGEEEIVQMEIDHYCESKFVFHKQGKKLEKCINQFLLVTKMIDENTPNDNYELNQKSILNTIHKLVEYEVAE